MEDTTTIDLKDDQAQSFLEKKQEQRERNLQFLSYTLVFNAKESFFETQDMMENDSGVDLIKTAWHAGVFGIYYSNIEENLKLRYFESMDKSLLLHTKFHNLDWTIGKETKVIQGYTCQKATATANINGIKKRTVTAWFTREIPFQFGPAGIDGLPGMILGLERRNIYFYADSISLSKKSKKIERPTRGQKISEGEWKELLEEALQQTPWGR